MLRYHSPTCNSYNTYEMSDITPFPLRLEDPVWELVEKRIAVTGRSRNRELAMIIESSLSEQTPEQLQILELQLVKAQLAELTALVTQLVAQKQE